MDKGSNYDFNLVLKHLSEKFKEKQFICSGKHTENYLHFLPAKNIKYYIKLIYSFRSISNSLLNMTYNISEKVHGKL